MSTKCEPRFRTRTWEIKEKDLPYAGKRESYD
jgi:hypothetical protein